MSHVREVLCQPYHSVAPAGSGGLVVQDGKAFNLPAPWYMRLCMAACLTFCLAAICQYLMLC